MSVDLFLRVTSDDFALRSDSAFVSFPDLAFIEQDISPCYVHIHAANFAVRMLTRQLLYAAG